MSLPTKNEKPSLSEVIDNMISVRLMAVHTGLPARITKWDSSTQLCTVQPLIQKISVDDDTGDPVVSPYQLIASVPYVFPGGAGGGVRYPVAVGDRVWLVFSESCIDDFMQTGNMSRPFDAGRFGLTGAVALPCPRPRTAPIANLETSAYFFGDDSALRGFVAMAQETKAALDALKGAFNAHLHAVSGANTTTPTPSVTPGAVIPVVVSTEVASTTVKVSK